MANDIDLVDLFPRESRENAHYQASNYGRVTEDEPECPLCFAALDAVDGLTLCPLCGVAIEVMAEDVYFTLCVGSSHEQ